MIAHMAPFELGPGQTLSDEAVAKIFLETDVRAATRERGQLGGGERLILEGPPGRLVEAMELVQRLLAEPVGGDGHDDDEPRPQPQAREDAWSDACPEEEGRPDDLDAEEQEGEAGGDEEESYQVAFMNGVRRMPTRVRTIAGRHPSTL